MAHFIAYLILGAAWVVVGGGMWQHSVLRRRVQTWRSKRAIIEIDCLAPERTRIKVAARGRYREEVIEGSIRSAIDRAHELSRELRRG